MKKLISILLSICIIFSLCTISVIGSNAEVTTEYKDEFAKFALGDKYEELKDEVVYEEYYRYFSEGNNTDTPDWILGRGYTEMEPSYSKGVFGEYLVYGPYYSPYSLGFFVYDSSENEFYNLQDAWEKDFENISYAFEEYIENNLDSDVDSRYIYHIGDSDCDGELTILDATYIQRVIADLNEFSVMDEYLGAYQYYGKKINHISDYDFDGEVTIMDATAIQRHIAGLE